MMRISINGGLEWKYDISKDDLLHHMKTGTLFESQRYLGESKEALVTVNPAFISHFYEG